jgi:hypothetical protein
MEYEVDESQQYREERCKTQLRHADGKRLRIVDCLWRMGLAIAEEKP